MRVPAGDYGCRSGEVAAIKGVSRGRNPAGDRPGDPVRKIEAPLVNPRVTGVAVAGASLVVDQNLESSEQSLHRSLPVYHWFGFCSAADLEVNPFLHPVNVNPNPECDGMMKFESLRRSEKEGTVEISCIVKLAEPLPHGPAHCTRH